MGHVLSFPILNKGIQRRGDADVKVGSAEMQGYRIDMEDAMSIVMRGQQEKHKDKYFFGVYDGHGGGQASIFCSKRMHQVVMDNDNPMDKDTLVKAVMKADAEFLDTHEGDTKNHGSTSVFAVVEVVDQKYGMDKTYKVSVANVGDSRAIIIRKDGSIVEMTTDHKPETKEECDRIEAAGGSVSANRVDGQLAMSRAIGDYSYKGDTSLSVTEQKVIPVPDITTETINVGDRLLICCDGIVEQMTGKDAAAFVYNEFKNGATDPALVCASLLDQSVKVGSKDNHSAMIIEFTDGSSFQTASNADDYIPGAYEPFAHNEGFKDAFIKDAAKFGYAPSNETKWAALMAKAKAQEANMPIAPPPPPSGVQDADDEESLNPIEMLLGQLSEEQRLAALMSILQNRGAMAPGGDDGSQE